MSVYQYESINSSFCDTDEDWLKKVLKAKKKNFCPLNQKKKKVRFIKYPSNSSIVAHLALMFKFYKKKIYRKWSKKMNSYLEQKFKHKIDQQKDV